MDYTAFQASIMNHEPSMASGGTFKVTYLKEQAIYDPMSLDKFPTHARNFLDDLAGAIFAPDRRHTIVLGYHHTGKTFFIEQLANNIQYYAAQGGMKAPIFISISDVDMMELGNTENLKKLSHEIQAALSITEDNICFVTHSIMAALYLSTVLPRARVLLEADVDTVMRMASGNSMIASKLLENWLVADANNVFLPRQELIDLMHVSVVERLNKKFPTPLTKRQVASFINYCVREIPAVERDVEGETVIVMPPGIWATLLQRLMTFYTYNSDPVWQDKHGNNSFRKLMRRTIHENMQLFGNLAQEDETEDLQEEILRIIQSEDGRLYVNEGKPQDNAPAAVKPLQFKQAETLSTRLKTTIIGQEEAVEKVGDSLLVPAAGLAAPDKPRRSFLFLGPTGVGKTQLALDLAKEVSTQPLPVTRIDMSEYQSSHEVAKLFGAPPGYVGHDQGGILTSAVREHPQCIVLLDEIEKAHPQVWDSFLQVLDSGRMTDSHGQVVDFTQTIIIMTSNIGVQEANRRKAGFGNLSGDQEYQQRVKDASAIVMKELEKTMRPELLNRLDDIVLFHELDESTALAIAAREVGIVSERMGNQGFVLEAPSPEVLKVILDKSDISKYGAREIQRVVFRLISKPVAQHIVSTSHEKNFRLTVDENEIRVHNN